MRHCINFESKLMPVNIIHNKLGSGIYSIPDISFILNLPQNKVRRWLNEFWDDRLAKKYKTKYSWGEGRDKATNFYTLIEFYVFYHLRELNVSTKKIFDAHEEMADCIKTPYPFASAKLLSDGRDILYTLNDGTTVNANNKRQIVIIDLIREFYSKIEFSSNDIAEKFWPLGKDKKIVVDPHHQFGQPVIDDTNILAETIYDMYTAGEPISFLSHLYKLSTKEIKDAVELFNRKAA